MDYTETHKAVDGVKAAIFWRAAKHWLNVWAGAGFIGRVEGEKIYMTKGWSEKFPDGHQLISALRNEMIGLITKGNEACKGDPRLMVKVNHAYYMSWLIDRSECEAKQAEYLRRQAAFWDKGNEKYLPCADTAKLAREAAEEREKEITRLRQEIAEMGRK